MPAVLDRRPVGPCSRCGASLIVPIESWTVDPPNPVCERCGANPPPGTPVPNTVPIPPWRAAVEPDWDVGGSG